VRFELRREGYCLLVGDTDFPSETMVVPVREPMVASLNDFRYSPPAHVLADRYNSEYDDWFAEVERKRDVYRLVGREDEVLRYEYERTDVFKTRDRYRINPERIPK
jgi:hypothetical protein